MVVILSCAAFALVWAGKFLRGWRLDDSTGPPVWGWNRQDYFMMGGEFDRSAEYPGALRPHLWRMLRRKKNFAVLNLDKNFQQEERET